MSDPVDEAIRVLNEALEADPKAVARLLEASVVVNDDLAAHPTIQCGVDDGVVRLRPLGLINGLFGIHENGWGYIAAVAERKLDGSTGRLRFQRYRPGDS